MTVYIIQEILGGVSQGVRVFATQEASDAAFLALAREYASCDTLLSSKGVPITPEQAVRHGYWSSADGDDDCIQSEAEIEGLPMAAAAAESE